MRAGIVGILFASIASGSSLVGCAEDKQHTQATGKVDAGPSPGDTCGSVRLTSYTASTGGWCEFDRTAPMLPDFVRQGLTVAIAEPWNGSSYAGQSGEACGECWELSSIDATRIVMVHDLCPIEGNPVCNGSHFHFDVSTETSQALSLEGLDEGSTRRVPCPVTGNAHLQIVDRNQWGYVRFQVLNHRIPVRSIEYRATDSDVYYPAERSGGAWAVGDNDTMFASDAAGGRFRLTSAQGEVLDMPNALTYDVAKGSFFDLGAQFTDQSQSSTAQCKFLPPREVYVDGYGGIEEVRWMMNPWASATASEVASGCVSGTCLRIDGMGSGAGFHIYYRQSFSATLYKNLHLAVRTTSGTGTIGVTLTGENTSCETTEISLTDAWQERNLALTDVCATAGPINTVTIYGNSPLTLLLDNLSFEP
jgi:hypothetical protein